MLNIFLFVLGIISTIILFWINYQARVIHSNIFYESNKFNRNLERKIGKPLAVFMIIPLHIIMLSITFYLSIISSELNELLGFWVGLVFMNAMLDFDTFRDKMINIGMVKNNESHQNRR